MTLPSTKELATWVGKPYAEGSCWDPFARDAFRDLAGVELPESYYDALPLFDTVHDCKNKVPFTAAPWDVVMIRAHRFLILHCAIALDGERFIQPWGETGLVICRFDDEQWSKRIAGYLRHRGKPTPE